MPLLLQFSQSGHILHGSRFHPDQRIGLQLQQKNVAGQIVLGDPFDFVARQIQLLQMDQFVQTHRNGGQQVLLQISEIEDKRVRNLRKSTVSTSGVTYNIISLVKLPMESEATIEMRFRFSHLLIINKYRMLFICG